jgi:DNA polymerase elongation subunit (family B)
MLNGENYYTVDVNSLYPNVMQNNQYPIKYKGIKHNVSIKTLAHYISSNSVVAKILIETDEPAYAIKRDRTIFPIGCFWTVLTTPELKYALEHNHIKEIKECVIYEQANIFDSYVRTFYNLRRRFESKGNTEYAEFCKKLLNSLYGKFGQKAEIWEKIGDCAGEIDRTEDCFRSGENHRGAIRYLLGEIFELKGYEECFDSFPAIPAHVAAYGRMYIYELMRKAGKGNYFYCDTDSLIINKVGLCNLQSQIDNVTLGKLKIVSTSKEIIIRGLKDYTIAKKSVIKGIRKNAIEISEGVFTQEIWPSFKGLLRSDNANSYVVKTQTKILSRKYTKGDVDKEGNVTPKLLDESYILEPSFV